MSFDLHDDINNDRLSNYTPEKQGNVKFTHLVALPVRPYITLTSLQANDKKLVVTQIICYYIMCYCMKGLFEMFCFNFASFYECLVTFTEKCEACRTIINQCVS